uniref:ribbon-helix-helix domain-containing protein n=1 Tax=Hassallia byssoidea TaxID=482630 RepID=UPI000AD716BD|nr:CopG family transcriptional regulator [Hassalia byssoidea]
MNEAEDMVRLNLDLSPELNEILEELANKIGGSKSDVLRQAITLMQVMVIAKEQTKKLGIAEADQLIANEIIMPSEASPKIHPLETLIEKFGTWEDKRTTENIIKDIYDSRSIANSQSQEDVVLERKLRELKSKQELRKDWILFILRDVVIFSAASVFIFAVGGYSLFTLIKR